MPGADRGAGPVSAAGKERDDKAGLAPGQRRWRWLGWLAAGVAGALVATLVLTGIGAGPAGESRGPRIPETELVQVLSRMDASRPGRMRRILVVRPKSDDLLPDSQAVMESIARTAARRALRDGALDAVEIRLVRNDGQEALRLRMSAASDGWDGSEEWEWQVLPPSEGG